MDEERSTAEATLREFLNEGGKLHLHVLLSVAQALKHDAKLQLQEPHSEASPLGSIVVGQNVESQGKPFALSPSRSRREPSSAGASDAVAA